MIPPVRLDPKRDHNMPGGTEGPAPPWCMADPEGPPATTGMPCEPLAECAKDAAMAGRQSPTSVQSRSGGGAVSTRLTRAKWLAAAGRGDLFARAVWQRPSPVQVDSLLWIASRDMGSHPQHSQQGPFSVFLSMWSHIRHISKELPSAWVR